MVDGGDQARAFHPGSFGSKVSGAAPQYVAGQTTRAMAGEAKNAIGASRSLASAGELACIARKMGSERSDVMEHLASRATSIANRIVGPFPSAAQPKDPSAEEERPESLSALDALHRDVSSVRDPLIRMDPALQELSAALDVLERAIG